jgi:hypothetical protein
VQYWKFVSTIMTSQKILSVRSDIPQEISISFDKLINRSAMFLDDLWGDFTLAFGSAGCEVLRVLLGHFLKVWPTSYDEPTESWYHIRSRPGPPYHFFWFTANAGKWPMYIMIERLIWASDESPLTLLPGSHIRYTPGNNFVTPNLPTEECEKHIQTGPRWP